MAERKLFAGARLKRFRKGLGLTQAQMAADLGVSASYLNLIERDQRPVSARVLLQLADAFDLDLRTLAADADERLLAGLSEATSDPLLATFELTAPELRELAETQPRAAEALVRLHTAYRETADDAAAMMERLASDGAEHALGSELPVEEVRDALHARDNYFPDLEAAAERFLRQVDLVDGAIYAELCRHLLSALGVAVRIMPYDVMGGDLRRYDFHARRLLLSEMLEAPARIFQAAVQIGLMEEGALLDELVDQAGFASEEARRLYRIHLANYFAAAVMMPYEPFREAAEGTRYDIEVLARRFSASFEQVCHRLTTLHRPGGRGVGFFMLRVDHAGNVSKRYGGTLMHFARSGAGCPRWGVFEAFREPGRVLNHVIETPDGKRFFTISRTVRRPAAGPGAPGQLLAVSVGCAIEHAERLVYLDQDDGAARRIAVPVGVTCRLCERPDCHQRAHPPLRRRLFVDERRRALAPYAFRSD